MAKRKYKPRTPLGKRLLKIRKRIVDSGVKLMTMDEITGHGDMTLKRVTRKPSLWAEGADRRFLMDMQYTNVLGKKIRQWVVCGPEGARFNWEGDMVECYELPKVKP